MKIRENPPRRTAFICIGIALLGLIIIFLPGIIGLDGFDGGFALSSLGVFVMIIGIVASVIYMKLARTLNRILTGDNLLAHWKYTPEEWRKYTEEEHAEDREARRGLFKLITIITVIVGIGLWIVKRDNPLLIIIICLGIIAIAGLSAYLSTMSNYRRNKKYPGEVYITRDGVYLNRQLHIWKGMGNRLEDVAYDDTGPGRPRIKFDYSSPSRYSRNYYTARVPVPPGEDTHAQQIVAQIAATHLLSRNQQ